MPVANPMTSTTFAYFVQRPEGRETGGLKATTESEPSLLVGVTGVRAGNLVSARIWEDISVTHNVDKHPTRDLSFTLTFSSRAYRMS